MGKVYVYARSSTNEQEDTLTGQVSRGEAEYKLRFASECEWGGAFVDRGVSGSKSFAKRPRGFELHLALASGDVVIMTKLDRGFRSFRDFVETLARFTEKGVRLIVLDLGVDTGTMVGRLIGNILASVAEFERERGRERTMEALAVRRKEGRPQGSVPYGFRIDRNAPKKRLMPDLRMRDIGRRALAWFDDGWALEKIYWHLAQNGIRRIPPGKKGVGREFSVSAIYRMIREEKRYQAIEAQGIEVTAQIVATLERLPL